MFKSKILVEYKEDWSKDLMMEFNVSMESIIYQTLSETEALDIIKIKYSNELSDNIKKFFSKYNNIKAFKILEENKHFIYFQIISICSPNTNKFFKNSCYQLGPLLMKNGKEFWDVISTSKKNVRELLKDLNDETRIAKLISIENYNFEKSKLTNKQFVVLESLYEAGYFEIPKKITLDDTSRILKTSKSTLNVHLNKSINKIIQDLMRY
jgi:predicted DNA binding protein